MGLRLGFDIDGVLADFQTALGSTCQGLAGIEAGLVSAPRPAHGRVEAGLATDRPNAELVDDSVGLRAGPDRAALRAHAAEPVGGLLPHQASTNGRRHRASPNPMVDREPGLLLAIGCHGPELQG